MRIVAGTYDPELCGWTNRLPREQQGDGHAGYSRLAAYSLRIGTIWTVHSKSAILGWPPMHRQAREDVKCR
jgi:hypothetical protein